MNADIHDFPQDHEVHGEPDDGGRAPLPVNYEVEQGILAGLLSKNRWYDDATEAGLEAKHFADDLHARIFEAIGRLIEDGKTASAATLAPFFTADEATPDQSASGYLSELQRAAQSFNNTRDYAETLIGLWQLREAIFIGEGLIEQAGLPDLDDPAEAVLERAAGELMELRDGAGQTNGTISIHGAAQDWLETIETARGGQGITGVPTGLDGLDRHLGGMGDGHLIVVAGATAMGKSALANTIAYNAAHGGARGLFWTMEMTAGEVAGRMLAGETGISADRQRRGQVGETDMLDLNAAHDALKSLPLTIEEPYQRTSRALKARARSLKRKGGLDFIVIDYLQLMRGSGERGYQNRTNEVDTITRDLKALAKALKIPIVLLAQLNREVDRRDDKRPRLGDLRESGSIEQDADVVMLCYREYYYLSRDEPVKRDKEAGTTFDGRLADWEANMAKTKDIGEIIIAKNRHGPTAKVTLHFDGPGTVFRDEPRGGGLL